MCINELQMDHDHTYAKDPDRELRILKKKFDLSNNQQDQENNDFAVLQAELCQDEEEGAGVSFMPSQDLAPEDEEERKGGQEIVRRWKPRTLEVRVVLLANSLTPDPQSSLQTRKPSSFFRNLREPAIKKL